MKKYKLNKIYIIEESIQEDRLIELNGIEVYQYNAIKKVEVLDGNDLLCWHLGDTPSKDIDRNFLKDILNKYDKSNIEVSNIICFSRGAKNKGSWDKIADYIDILADNPEKFLEYIILAKNQFQNNLNLNFKKYYFKTIYGSFLNKKYSLAAQLDSATEHYYDSQFDNCESFIRAYNDNHSVLNPNKRYGLSEVAIFNDNLSVISELQTRLNNKVEIIPFSLYLRPSNKLWATLKNIKSTVFIFLIAPWESEEDFIKEGYTKEEHKNIILWNLLTEFDDLKNKSDELVKLLDDRNHSFEEKFSEIKELVIADIDTDLTNEIIKELCPFGYLQWPYLHLINSKDSSYIETLFLFDYLGNNYDQHTHKFNSDESSLNNVDFLMKHQIYQLKQRCTDALESINYLYRLKLDIDKKLKIAVIDDKPLNELKLGGIQIEKVLNSFIGENKYEIIYSNPESYFDSISKYTSLKNNIDKKLIKEFDRIFKAEIILVDLLYCDIDGIDKKRPLAVEQGLSLLSGLNRFIKDMNSSVVNEAPPSLVAFSQDNNPDTIVKSIKAGAKDYILKARPFLFPAMLSKIFLTRGEQTNTYHRNFRSIYNLDNETIGLLQKTKISSIDPNKNNASKRKIIEILNAIPKTDLHVHVGSCMTPEFLALASFITLCRHNFDCFSKMRNVITVYHRLITEKKYKTFTINFFGENNSFIIDFTCGENWIDNFSKEFKSIIIIKIEECFSNIDKYNHTRKNDAKRYEINRLTLIKSFFHKEFKIPDYLDKGRFIKKIENIPNLKLAFYTFSKQFDNLNDLIEFDWIRIYILVLATKYKKGNLYYNSTNLLPYFEDNNFKISSVIFNKIRSTYYGNKNIGNFVSDLRKNGWLIKNRMSILTIKLTKRKLNQDELNFNQNPIEYILATGPRSSNLIEYLVGCEYAGAEHLQHPYLIHLYARQTIYRFIEQGVCYAELRGSPSGYVNKSIGFNFTDVINCFITAFNQTQEESYKYMLASKNKIKKIWGTLSTTIEIQNFKNPDNVYAKRIPCKANLIITGKRHKPLRSMILEAAAAASLLRDNTVEINNSKDFTNKSLRKTEVVGFDLAGKEEGNPPEKFINEFSRLSKLHIPLTIHAGENASAEFIESAVLNVGARRIGHGLSLAEDEELMKRLREQKVCIELCPVSNHQTSHFNEKNGKKYPLRQFIKQGLLVSISTDNPIISDTNLAKEYIKASETLDDNLSFWEVLRIVRMGYTTSFMSLPERKHFLELVDQHIFDLFSNSVIREDLYNLN